jgi:hypothetical protein
MRINFDICTQCLKDIKKKKFILNLEEYGSQDFCSEECLCNWAKSHCKVIDVKETLLKDFE